MSIRAIVFDLDGTLLDTLTDVGRAANAALVECGFSDYPLPAYRMLLGGGVRRLFTEALPSSARTDEQIDRAIAAFKQHYDRNWNATTRPYSGVPELIAELSRRGLPLAVLSNKPHEFTRICIAEHFQDHPPATADSLTSATLGEPIGPFTFVVGQRSGVPVKPDPAGALDIAEAFGIAPGEFLYLGDTSVDMQTARDAGMRPIGVLWGFREREELVGAGAESVIEKPEELLVLLDA